ncbi:MAG: DUF3306 domain-containing protein [Pseudomonadota bacterium]
MSDFWSRRRKAVEAEAEDAARAEIEQAEEAARADLEGLDDAAVLERLGLPEPDDLRPGDDVAAFMDKAVPRHLRNRVLRRLWTSNPVLANLDGLADYADDFTGSGLKGKVLQTTYEVGKGLAAHVKRMEAAEAPPKDREKHYENRDDPDQFSIEKNLAEPTADMEPFGSIPSDPDPGDEEEAPRPRMRFSFEEDDRSERPDPAGPGRPVPGGQASG